MGLLFDVCCIAATFFIGVFVGVIATSLVVMFLVCFFISILGHVGLHFNRHGELISHPGLLNVTIPQIQEEQQHLSHLIGSVESLQASIISGRYSSCDEMLEIFAAHLRATEQATELFIDSIKACDDTESEVNLELQKFRNAKPEFNAIKSHLFRPLIAMEKHSRTHNVAIQQLSRVQAFKHQVRAAQTPILNECPYLQLPLPLFEPDRIFALENKATADRSGSQEPGMLLPLFYLEVEGQLEGPLSEPREREALQY